MRRKSGEEGALRFRPTRSGSSAGAATSGTAGAAAVAGSTAPVRWGCDQSARWRRKWRVRGERGAGTGAPASLLDRLPPRPAEPCVFATWKPFIFFMWGDGRLSGIEIARMRGRTRNFKHWIPVESRWLPIWLASSNERLKLDAAAAGCAATFETPLRSSRRKRA